MAMKSLLFVAVAALSLAAPMTALADPHGDHERGERWRGDDRWRDGERRHERGEWRRHEWREDGWRGRESWGYRGYPWGWGYARRCWIEDRGYYDWYGYYVHRPIRICR